MGAHYSGGVRGTIQLLKYQSRDDGDVYAKEIWATSVPKMAVAMWRLRWDWLHTFDRIRDWGMPAPKRCALCDIDDEKPAHLFFKCNYSSELWKAI